MEPAGVGKQSSTAIKSCLLKFTMCYSLSELLVSPTIAQTLHNPCSAHLEWARRCVNAATYCNMFNFLCKTGRSQPTKCASWTRLLWSQSSVQTVESTMCACRCMKHRLDGRHAPVRRQGSIHVAISVSIAPNIADFRLSAGGSATADTPSLTTWRQSRCSTSSR
jgi:hypothetical protein